MLITTRATVLYSHSNGGSVLLGDETGRLTAIGWDLVRADEMIQQPDGSHGVIDVRKVDLGVVRQVFKTSPFDKKAAHGRQISPPSSLVPVGSTHVFITSITGDAQLVNLASARPDAAGVTSPPSKTSPWAIGGKKGKSRASAEAA